MRAASWVRSTSSIACTVSRSRTWPRRRSRKWELGQAGEDNGLLLVLVMEDRKSRFEVGYGLEGSITDVHARRALDDYLAPRMRAGDPAGAIVDAFDYLSRPEANTVPGPVASGLMNEAAASESPSERVAPLSYRLGQALVILIAFAAAMVALHPFDNWWRRRCIAKLLRADPSLPLKSDPLASEELETDVQSETKKKDGPVILIASLLFIAAFPTIFAFAVFTDYPKTFWGFLAAPPVLLILGTYLSNRKYSSLARYRQYFDRLAEERRALIAKGHMEETSPGVFKYTAAYHEARRASAQRSSSSSSSSSSRSSSRSSSSRSSSRGGRSGGGGSSSGW